MNYIRYNYIYSDIFELKIIKQNAKSSFEDFCRIDLANK